MIEVRSLLQGRESMAAPKPNLPRKQPEQKSGRHTAPREKLKKTLIGPPCSNDCGQKGSGLLIGQALPVEVSPLEGLGMGFSHEKRGVVCHSLKLRDARKQ